MTVKELNAKVEELEARLDDVNKFYYQTSKELSELVANVVNDNKMLINVVSDTQKKFEKLEVVLSALGILTCLVALFALFV